MIQPEPITVDGRDGVVVFLDADGQPVDPQSPAAVLARAVFDDGGRATYTVEPKKINLGGEGSGNFGHAGRPGEVGGSGPGGGPREFKGDEGFDWHEAPAMEDYVKTLPYEDVEAVAGYAGFGYDDINRHLRGSFEPRIINEFVREATPEEIARFGKGGPDPERPWLSISAEKRGGYPPRDASDYLPDDPVNKVDDGRIVHNVFTEDPKTGEKVEWSIQRAVPDLKYVAKLESQTAKIDESIRSRGYELPEPIKVNRAAYIPGLSFDELKSMEGEVIEEKGFTSTMVGNPNKRLDAYVVGGKTESLSKRYPDESWDARMAHQDEVGAAMRIEIVLPKGTKVAPVEAIRRIDHEFPKIQDPAVFDHPEWLDVGTHGEKLKPEDFTIRNYAAKPTVKTNRLHDKGQRSEAEILLGSGAQFRIDHVQHGERGIITRDLHPIDVIDVRLTYIGGGSSEGPESPALRATLEHPESKPKKLSYREKLAALVMLGGEGSGNFGHVGRPGEVGGSGSGGGQARAKAGGEYGPNDDWYPGGAFIATTDMPKRERAKIDRMAANDMEMVDIGGPRQKIAPGQIPIVRDVGTAVNRDFSINETYLDRAGYDEEHKAQIRAAAARAVKGERLFDIKEFPALARVDDVVRLIAADKPVPGAALDRALKYRPDLGKYLVRAKPLSLGGAGSGNFGHAGRPGEVGGSAGEAKDISQRDRKRDERFREMLGKMAEQHHERKAREEEAAARSDVDYQHNTATHADVTARLEALVPKSYVARAGRTKESQIANTAASHVVEVLEEMKAQGYEMPDSVAVHLKPTGGVRGQVVFELGKRSLTINIPKALPADANLNDAVAIAFGGRDDGHERFAVRSMNDVVVHEMGHVQAGSRTKPGQSGLTSAAVQAFPTKDAQHAAMREVSNYAATNPDEFLAESFTRLYRGETLPKNAQRLYDALNGPKVRR